MRIDDFLRLLLLNLRLRGRFLPLLDPLDFLLPGRRFLLLDFLFGGLFGDEYSFLHGYLRRFADGFLLLDIGIVVENQFQ